MQVRGVLQFDLCRAGDALVHQELRQAVPRWADSGGGDRLLTCILAEADRSARTHFNNSEGALVDLPLDCGEILPGHRFLITGIRNDGRSDDRPYSEITGHIEGRRGEPVVSVTYEVRPGLSEQKSHLYVDAGVTLWPRRPATSSVTPPDVVPGSVPEEREEPAGGPVTAGAFGPFVCPEVTEQIVLRLQPYQVEAFTSDGRPLNLGAADLLAGVDRVMGTATLDVVRQTALWEPDQSVGGRASQTRGRPVPRAGQSGVRHPRPMGEPGGGGDHGDHDSETQFDRWVQDPGGTWFHIQGLKTFAVSTPILIGPGNGGPDANVFWRAINAVLVRVQRPGTAERCQLTVFRVGKKGERPVWGFMGDWQRSHLEAGALVAEIRAGTFDPQSRPE